MNYKEMKERIKELGLEMPKGKNGGVPKKVQLEKVLEEAGEYTGDVIETLTEPLEEIRSDWHERRNIKY